MAGAEWDDEDASSESEAAASEPEPSSPEASDADDSMEADEAAQEERDGGGGAAERPATQAERRQQNIEALVSGAGLALKRTSLMPRLGLTVQQAAVVLRRPFKSPHPTAPAVSSALRRKLAARKTFVPWGGGAFVPLKLRAPPRELLGLPEEAPGLGAALAAPAAEAAVVLPPGVEPLVLWEPPPGEQGQPVRVDDMLTQFLRPHQREGVQFMFECVTGLRSFEGQGCILADDMGLGKTLQGISLLWTLLSARGHPLLGGDPVARRVVICCPTSLVGNWDSECQKWLKGRVRTLPLCESSRDEAAASIAQFLSPRCPYQVMIVSYETFRTHTDKFGGEGSCDLLICDEAHRLKNDATLTNRALGSLACRRRVLLSGTPLQNRLDEFYAMVSFCNPGVLGSPAQFRRRFEAPILAGREPGASEAEAALCQERTAELSALVNEFILRRTNTLLSQHLPPKVVEIVCCRLTPLQRSLYCHFLDSKAAAALFATQKAARVLSAITSLRKLLNHPKLIWDAMHSHAKDGGKDAEGFEGAAAFFPVETFGAGRAARSGMAPGWELMSGKFAVLAHMLQLLRGCTKDRIVVVSNYTQTLDLVAQLCRDRGYPFVRLDGTTTIKKRNKLVKDFNDPAQAQFAFLLSSKAGGCGLNLIGANRLVLFDPSWNPADDKQAAARVWRDGQAKRVYVYRFLAAGSIEEKVYQRQLSKEGLQQVVDSKAGGKAGPNLMSMEELRDLFSFDPATLSTTFDSLCCQRLPAPAAAAQPTKGKKAAAKKKAVPKKARAPASGRKRRSRAWSSSEEEEEEEEGGDGHSGEESEWEEWGEEAAAGPAAGSTRLAEAEQVVVPDTDEEEEGGYRQQGQQAQAEDSSGWSSHDDGDDEAPGGRRQQPGPPPAARAEQQAEAGSASGRDTPAGGEASAAVPGAPEEGTAGAEASGGGGAAAQGVQRQLLVPTTQIGPLGITIHNAQVGKPGEEQLRLWAHHSSTASVPDQVLRCIGDEHVSFVFTLEVDGRPVEAEPPLAPLPPPAAAGAGALGPRRPRQQQAAAAALGAQKVPAPAQAQAAQAPQLAQQQQQQQQRLQPHAVAAKENAASNAPTAAAGSKLGARATGPAAPRQPQGLAAAVKRAVHVLSDSDEDFK